MAQQPLFSLVVPVYGVEEWIADFLESLRVQHGGLGDTELVFVIDGSPDDSERVLRDWLGTTGIEAKVVVQENRGLAEARNTGLSVATGAWISFPDPDDILHEGYLQAVRNCVADDAPETGLISTRLVRFWESVSDARDEHPLGFKHRRGTRTVNLLDEPQMLQLSGASAFLRRSVVEGLGLRFDGRIKPVFEDAHLIARYLLAQAEPLMTVCAEAFYYYRQRSAGGSLVQQAGAAPGRYAEVVEIGYLALLEEASPQVPVWLQYLVMYDIQWSFKLDRGQHSPTASLTEKQCEKFLGLAERVFGYIDDRVFFEYNVTSIPMELRIAFFVLKNGYAPSRLDTHITRVDRRSRLMQIRYFSAEVDPVEHLELDGRPGTPVYEKSRAVRLFRRTVLYERILWVTSMQNIRFTAPGETERSRIRFGWMGEPSYEVTVGKLWAHTRELPDVLSAARAMPEVSVPRRGAIQRGRSALRRRIGLFGHRAGRVWEFAERLWVRWRVARDASRYQNAWVLIDREQMARDNAESYYRYLRREQPDVNAWFVIKRGSGDYRRLKRDGFRVVAHGSLRHVVLMRHAEFLISSQADHYILNPYDQRRFGAGDWKYVFLQHGVTMNDLSHWLNHKSFDLFVTSTRDEYRSITADETPYTITSREVVLTGFPRFDELFEMASRTPLQQRRALVIVPTWREGLTTNPSGGGERELIDGFWSSRYVREWLGLLNSPELKMFSERHGLEIVFAPHPNFQGHITRSHVPEHVRLVNYDEVDIKSVLATSRIAMTDYSSLSFDAAFAGSPVLYFQFDSEEFFGGSHVFRKGYFEHAEHGFGPVATDRSEVLRALDRLMTDSAFEKTYLDRIASTYEYRDADNSRRVYEAMLAAKRPWYEGNNRDVYRPQLSDVDVQQGAGMPSGQDSEVEAKAS